jgi:hypothetical protein
LIVLAFGPGKDPINPDLHASMTTLGLETKNMGATIAGITNFDLMEVKISFLFI